MTGVLTAFAWAVAATLALGTIGGLWLSAQFLGRIDSMRQTARRLMDGDWSRRIPLSRTDDDLTALARTFNRLFDRIEKLLQANKQVSADIAHDLRKPLAGVLRRLEVVRDEPSSGAARGSIDVAIGDVEGVLETFNALLRIGQVEAGARRAAFRPLDLAEVAREVAETFAPAAEDESKTLVQRLDAPLPISGDKELLVQMIANLIDNALRHTPAGVRIEVAGERTPAGIAFSVSDNGPGVAAREMTAIFQRFHRSATRRARRERPRSRAGRRDRRPARPRLLGPRYNHPGVRVTIAATDNAVEAGAAPSDDDVDRLGASRRRSIDVVVDRGQTARRETEESGHVASAWPDGTLDADDHRANQNSRDGAGSRGPRRRDERPPAPTRHGRAASGHAA